MTVFAHGLVSGVLKFRRRNSRSAGTGSPFVSVQTPLSNCPPWRLDPGSPCRDDGEGLNAYHPLAGLGTAQVFHVRGIEDAIEPTVPMHNRGRVDPPLGPSRDRTEAAGQQGFNVLALPLASPSAKID